MLRYIAVSLGLALATGSSALAKDVDFKGDPLGMTLLDFQQKHDLKVPGQSEAHAPYLQFPGTNHDSAEIDCTLTLPSENNATESKDTVIGRPATISYTFVCKSHTDWDRLAKVIKNKTGWGWNEEEKQAAKRARLSQVYVDFENNDYDPLLATLTEKYVPPTHNGSKVAKDSNGEIVHERRQDWQFKDGTVALLDGYPTGSRR